MMLNVRTALVSFALLLTGSIFGQQSALGPRRELADVPQNVDFADFRAMFAKVNGKQIWLPKSARFAVFVSGQPGEGRSEWQEVGWVWKSERLGRLVAVTGTGRLVPVDHVVEYRQPTTEDVNNDAYIPSMRLGGAGATAGGFDIRRAIFVFWAMGEKALVEKFIEEQGDLYSKTNYEELDFALMSDRRIDFFYALKQGDLDIAEAIAELCELAGAERPRYEYLGTLPFTGSEMVWEVRFWRGAKHYTQQDFDRIKALPETERIHALIELIDMRADGFDWWSDWQLAVEELGDIAVEPLLDALGTQNHMLLDKLTLYGTRVDSKRTVIQTALQRVWKGFPSLVTQDIPGYEVEEIDRLKGLWREQKDLPLGDRLANWLIAEDWQRVTTLIDPYIKQQEGIPELKNVLLPEITEGGRKKIVDGIVAKVDAWVEGGSRPSWINSMIPLLIAADRNTAREVLKKVAIMRLEELRKWSHYHEDHDFALLTIYRMEVGDQAEALKDFYSTVPSLLEKPEDRSQVFIVASAFPNLQELQNFTRKSLNTRLEKALPSKEPKPNYDQLTMLVTDYLYVDSPGVRAFWLDCLERKDEVGSIIFQENGVQIFYGAEYSPRGELAPEGDIEPLQLCELVAMQLSYRMEGIGDFDRAGRQKFVNEVKKAVAANRFKRW